MGEWECANCGHIHDGQEAPRVCPDCGAPKERFAFYPLDDQAPDEWDDEVYDLLLSLEEADNEQTGDPPDG
ncbi:MAG: hypothetical protein HY259_04600 [Chloroflexi bacterium]|nr:hypothetical protein [Chloroflexota bacterium]MBI3732722.1 hypothetical protein [Chloroflexota bacterium]